MSDDTFWSIRPRRRDADERIRHRVPGSQNAVALTPRSTSYEQAARTPQAAQKRSLNEVRRIDEEDVARAGSRRFQQRFQRLVEERRLSLPMLLDRLLRRQRDRGRATPLQAETFFRNFLT